MAQRTRRADSHQWSTPVVTRSSKNSEVEAKQIKDALLVKHPYWKTIRINGWIARFIHDCEAPRHLRTFWPLMTTIETEQQVKVVDTESAGGDRNRRIISRRSDSAKMRMEFTSAEVISMEIIRFICPQISLSEKIMQDVHLCLSLLLDTTLAAAYAKCLYSLYSHG